MTYTIYFIQNPDHIDLFSTVSEHVYSGLNQSSTPNTGSHIEKYSHISPLWPEWEELLLGRNKRLMKLSIRNCLLRHYIWSHGE